MVPVDPTAYWQAAALLRLDRREGMRRLEDCFRAGAVPRGLDGPLAGCLLATTVGRGLDGPFELMARLWMPWRGKTFDSGRGEGRNIFTAGGRRAIRVSMPGYSELRDEADGRCNAFRFTTSAGTSALLPETQVLRIDYRDVAENPAWPVRRILDELVVVGDQLYLGQALMLWRGTVRRAAWFSLEAGR